MTLTKSELDNLARQVADNLPDWTFSGCEYNHRAELRNNVGQGLMFLHQYPDTNANRVRIVGIYPDGHTAHNFDRPSIGVSATKDPAKIAADIARRFLPEYEVAYGKALDMIAADKRANHARAGAITMLAEAWHRPDPRGGNYPDEIGVGNLSDDWYGNLRVHHYGDECTLELRGISVDVAAQIGRLMNEQG